ncbi:zf-HC2 domain-containing protein [Streptomyces sp. NPDC048664]|uniref:zf-HC2 domain-containing protein n=1 Tax=Streptomyces sp. NPDC048664 TaxID=3154505 RepID=UPI00343EE6AF
MSASRRPTPAEQHLGDRLSALVDGELGHDTRERVLAHLATCAKCKAEADAQRRLKNVFAAAAPPPPSESFLARLQGLSGGGDRDADDEGTPLGRGGFPGRLQSVTGLPSGPGAFGMRGEPFVYAPSGPHAALSPAGERGFRVHPVGRQDAERSSRGLRFAFVAAGAVSLAAIALGGVSTGITTAGGAESRGGTGGGSNVTPLRSPGTGGTGTTSSSETQRRRSIGPLLEQRAQDGVPAASRRSGAPLLPAGAVTDVQDASDMRSLTAPVLAGAAVMPPPLIRQGNETAPLTLTSLSATPSMAAPALPAVPVPAAPSATASPSSSLTLSAFPTPTASARAAR